MIQVQGRIGMQEILEKVWDWTRPAAYICDVLMLPCLVGAIIISFDQAINITTHDLFTNDIVPIFLLGPPILGGGGMFFGAIARSWDKHHAEHHRLVTYAVVAGFVMVCLWFTLFDIAPRGV